MRLTFLFGLFAAATLSADAADRPFGLAIHGGAGVIERADLSPELEAEYRAKLNEALEAGYAVLARGGTSLDAVTTAIVILEDSPLFNAGKGAVMNAEGSCELDASIMDGRTLAAGAVAGVQRIRNPILLARDVMEKSPHVMMTGPGAERFAQSLGYDFVPNEYFHTETRRRQLEQARERENSRRGDSGSPAARESKFGTVGCVALDQAGNLAAGTSTGGMTNKKYGRVGDSPIIGAGTYANNATAAVSCTGHGEFYIRTTVAHEVSAQIEHRGASLADAAAAAIHRAEALGGTGGLIAIDARANVALPFNTSGMYRGYRVAGKPAVVEIFGAGDATPSSR